jgi:predicted  nucleic acid-binding Zn-ribbon protein
MAELISGAAQMSARDEHIDRMAARLKDWAAELDSMEARAKLATADVKGEIETRIAELKAQRDLVSSEMQRLRAATESAWTDLFDGAQAMTNALEHAFERARSRFRD